MVLVLCIGDLNIPHRALDLPSKFKQLLVPGKIHRILVTGNLCDASVQEYLRSLCGDVTITQGNFDEPGRWPDAAVITVGDLKIGVTHGHQHVPWEDKATAARVARRMDVDVLVMGHSSRFEAFQQEGRLILFPGTATGSFMPLMPLGSQDPTPSFALMDVNGARATVYVYELVEGNVKVDKIDFKARPREA
jgi:vacuolar protein sorting-associated protein 29